MYYLYETKSGAGHVREIWDEAPTEADRGDLEVLEIDHPNAPTSGNWRVSGGHLVERPGSEADYERRQRKARARRAP